MKYFGAALAVTCLFATPALLAEVPRGREAVSINVSTEGLDLTSQQGVRRLQTRMDQAIATACNPGDRLNADMSPDFRCRREMAADAWPTMQKLTAQAVATPTSTN
jgi:UrcA family protein